MQEQPELKTHAKAHVELRHLKIPVLPSPITALAVKDDLVLVGKENGFIEILQYPTFIKIGQYISILSVVRQLIWIDGNQFIAIFLAGNISLFDINSIKPIASFQLPENINIYDGFINNNIVVGCSDGSIRLFELDQNKIIQRGQTQQLQEQCLSVTHKQDVIYASFSNGFLRSYSQKTLILQQSWSLNVSNLKISDNNKIVPWKLIIFNNNLIVGTNIGQLFIYETSFNTQIQQLQTHEGDILALFASDNILYASGCDSKIVQLGQQKGKYIKIGESRGQSHDIYAIQALQDKIISGGITSDICLHRLEGGIFKQSDWYHAYTINSEFVYNNNLLFINHQKSIDIIGIGENQNPIYLSEIELSQPAHFLKVFANYVCYGQTYQTTFLKIDSDNQLKKFKIFPHFKNITFQQKIFYAIDQNNRLYKYKYKGQNKFLVQLPNGQPKLMEFLDKRNILITYPNNQFFVVFNIKDQKLHEIDCQLNQNKVSNILQVRGTSKLILVTYVNQAISGFIYNYQEKEWRMMKYCRDQLQKCPLHYTNLKQPIKGVITDPKDDRRMLLYTDSYFIRVHLRGKPPQQVTSFKLEDKVIQQKKQQSIQELHLDINYSIVQNKNHILHALHKQDDQYILLEWDIQMSFDGLPAALQAKRYKR